MFVGLLALGLREAHSRTLSPMRAFALPLALLAGSVYSVPSTPGWHAGPLLAWAAGLGISTLLAQLLWARTPLTFDAQQRRFWVPGSWVPMLVIMVIFWTRYAVGLAQAHNGQEAALSAVCALALSALLGACSGYFAARTLALVRVARQGLHPRHEARRP